MGAKNNRKELIIDPKLQYRIMTMIISVGVSVCVTFLCGLYFFMKTVFDFLDKLEGLSIDSKIMLFSHWNNMLYLLIVLVGITIFGTWLWAKSFTNKIAGPIYSMNRTLDSYLAGDKSARIKLREKDYFSNLGEKINQTLEKQSK